MRTARSNVFGCLYHLIWRFTDARWFIQDDEDRATYLRLLGYALGHADWLCVAYAIMSNHLHLAMIAGRCAMSDWTQRVNPAFAQWINDKYRRRGGVIADRAKDYAIMPADEARVIAYIHNNPVRAHVVATARESTWTSHRAYVGLVPRPPWLATGPGLTRAGFVDPLELDVWASREHVAWTAVDVTRARRAAAIRGTLNVATPTASNPPVIPIVARPFAHVRPDPKRVVEIVAAIRGLSTSELCTRRRYPAAKQGRELLIHSAVAAGLNFSDIASALGISRQAVGRTAQRPVSDELLDELSLVKRRIDLECGR